MTKNLTSAKGNGSSSFFLHPSSLSTQGWPSSRADRCPIIEMRPDLNRKRKCFALALSAATRLGAQRSCRKC
jgi:hypothetical protein